MTRRMASLRRQLLSASFCLRSASWHSCSSASRCRISIRSFQLTAASALEVLPVSRLELLDEFPPRCCIRDRSRSVAADGDAELTLLASEFPPANLPVAAAFGVVPDVASGAASVRGCADELLLALGAALMLRGDTNEGLGDAIPRRKARRSSGNDDAPPGSSEPELPGGTGGLPERPAARGVDALLGQGGTASLQELPPPGSSPGSSCVAMVTIPRRSIPPSRPLGVFGVGGCEAPR